MEGGGGGGKAEGGGGEQEGGRSGGVGVGAVFSTVEEGCKRLIRM